MRIFSLISSLDAMTGGIAPGQAWEICDDGRVTGKTSLALAYCEGCQAAGGTVLYIGLEDAFNKGMLTSHGVDPDRFLYMSHGDYSEIEDAVDFLSHSVNLIVLDSLASVADDADTVSLPTRTRRMIRRICASLAAGGASLLFLNQLRGSVFGVHPIGGHPVRAWASNVITLSSGHPHYERHMVVGERVKVRANEGETHLVLRFGSNASAMHAPPGAFSQRPGFDRELDLIEYGVRLGAITRSSNKIIYNGDVLGTSLLSAARRLAEYSSIAEEIKLALERGCADGD